MELVRNRKYSLFGWNGYSQSYPHSFLTRPIDINVDIDLVVDIDTDVDKDI